MIEFNIILLIINSIAFVHGLNEISERKYTALRILAKSWGPMLITGLLGIVIEQLSTISQLM